MSSSWGSYNISALSAAQAAMYVFKSIHIHVWKLDGLATSILSTEFDCRSRNVNFLYGGEYSQCAQYAENSWNQEWEIGYNLQSRTEKEGVLEFSC